MKIKICGITSEEEAEYLNRYNVDFAGFVLFFPKSRRNLDLNRAVEISARLSKSIKRVAVTVKPTLEQVLAIEGAGFDYIQVHDALHPDILEKTTIPILKAFNVKDMDNYPDYHSNPRIAGYIFDAQEPGSGKTFDWSLVDNIPRDEKLLLLAGGLDPNNVKTAIQLVKPDGVDVSSGVEYGEGTKRGKDPRKIKEFAENARGAYL